MKRLMVALIAQVVPAAAAVVPADEKRLMVALVAQVLQQMIPPRGR
jgi:hypothetical protein